MKLLAWMVAGVLCCAAGAAAEGGRPEAGPGEAQTAYAAARALYEAGKYTDAITQGERALREAVLGKEKAELARCLDLLGVLYRHQGDRDRARPLLLRALELREAVLGRDHPDVAQTLIHLAHLHKDQGSHGHAEPLYLRALAIQRAALGENHPDVAQTLNGLAWLYLEQGLYDSAEPLSTRALAIQEATLGKNHPDVARTLNHLARCYSEQGLYDRAEPLYTHSLAIQEVALGESHPDLALVLNNLASLYAAQKLYARAAPLYERALALQEASLGRSHPEIAPSLNQLARFYLRQGMYDRVMPLARRARAIQEAAHGKNDYRLAVSLNHLALAYTRQGTFDQAEALYERALALRQAALGKNHPSVPELLTNLALLRVEQSRLNEALPLLKRAFAIAELHLRREGLGFSESRLAGVLEQLRAREDLIYEFLRARLDAPDVQRVALAAAFLRKGRSLGETSETSRILHQSLSAEDRKAFEQLRGLRSQLASLSLQGPGSSSLADYQRQIKELTEQGDALEAVMAVRSARLRSLTALPPPEYMVDRVAAALPRDSVLVEFIAYTDRSLVRRQGPPRTRPPDQVRYLALVLGPLGNLCVSNLGAAEPIDRHVSRLRAALARRDAEFLASAQASYRLVFEPLRMCLGDTRHLFLSPDGQLGLVPFAALHDGHQFLVDTYDFTYLTSGKELLPRTEEIAPSDSVVVLADPDLSASPQAVPAASAAAPMLAERSSALERFFSTPRAGLAEQSWTPLPGTRQEAEAIQRLFPLAQLFLGAEASKARLLRLSAPGVLHIATHGFFLEDAPTPEASRAVGHFGVLGDEALAPPPPDPMLRSGLVLAGAGAPAPDAGGVSSPLDSVLVTALELAGLNLWGTQLVVLSACDTGRGDVSLGQGVYGMRRAFIAAGAETVVTSLWKVNDETTRALMVAYYRNLLEGQGRGVAMREAMRVLREASPHPHYWAPFIVLGRDTPLLALAPSP